MIVELNSGNDRLLARITARSAKRLRLQPDLACYAIVKTLSIRPAEVAILMRNCVISDDELGNRPPLAAKLPRQDRAFE